MLNSVRQHNHFITQGNYKATCFDYRLVIFRPISSIVSQDAMHTSGLMIVFWNNALFETLLVEINVGTASQDFCS